MSNPTELPDLDRIEKEARSILGSLEKGYKGCVRESVRDILEIVVAARRAQPEGEAPQVEGYEVWNYAHECWEPTDKNGYLASHEKNRRIAPTATLSPLCGVQHAESGKEEFAWAVFSENGNVIIWSKNRAQVESASKEYGRPIVPVIALSAAQLDGGQEGSESNG